MHKFVSRGPVAGLGLIAFGAGVPLAQAQLDGDTVVTGLSQPVLLTNDGSTDRRFVVERTGTIQVIDAGGSLAGTYLDVSGDIAGLGGEGGLLGAAFHPGFNDPASPGFGQYFINYTAPGTGGDPLTTVIERVTVNDVASNTPTVTRTPVLSVSQPDTNHNGGYLGFGPDDLLYIPLGDGGGGNDTFGNGQDTTTLLGSLLRIDVNGDDFTADADRNYVIPDDNPFAQTDGPDADEIYAFGLRNPYRSSFDRLTGDLYLGDVGQGAREEIDVLPAGSGGGQNFGWNLREGFIETPGVPGDLAPEDRTDPIFDYVRGDLGRSITGGYVYRGDQLGPAYDGLYFFGDFVSGRVFTIDPANPLNSLTEVTDLVLGGALPGQIAGFGEDLDGELYVLTFSDGDVIKLVPEPASTLALLGLGGMLLRRRR